MASQFHQISDNIHEMINTTEFENFVINSPFFNRLHEVNQSSTVYMTFPSVRTKRYEHSLGVMQITSDVFYNATVNVAGSDTMNYLIDNLSLEYMKIENFIKNRGNLALKLGNEMDEYLDELKENTNLSQFIKDEFYECFKSRCLLNLVPGFIRDGFQAFLFVSIVQAIRFVGLLHDVGHPPQSHIIESVIKNIGENINNIEESSRTIRQKNFLKIYNKYRNPSDDTILLLDTRLAIEKESLETEETALHEMIGLYIIKSIFEWAIPKYLRKKNERTASTNQKQLWALYCLTVAEFTFGIIRNKDSFLAGLHNIVDGTVDTDRLDFVNRDTINAGVSWGNVPYKRLISTVKFGLVDIDNSGIKELRLCYNSKNVRLMEALIRDRYRIFSEINFHHKCTKIAGAYKRAVEALANSYLFSKEKDTEAKDHQYSDISGLWRMLDSSFSSKAAILNIAQWNDSWLTSMLYNCLTANYTKDKIKDHEIATCILYLKEIFFNEDTHISLIKRRTELEQINNIISSEVQEYLSALNDILYKTEAQLKSKATEIEKTPEKRELLLEYDQLSEVYYNANEIYCALYEKSWFALESLLGPDIFTDVIKTVLDNLKTSGEIKHYFYEKTSFSSGTKTENAFIYTDQNLCEPFEKYTDIKSEIETQRLNLPLYYIYFKPADDKEVNALAIRIELGRAIGKALLNAAQNYLEATE